MKYNIKMSNGKMVEVDGYCINGNLSTHFDTDNGWVIDHTPTGKLITELGFKTQEDADKYGKHIISLFGEIWTERDVKKSKRSYKQELFFSMLSRLRSNNLTAYLSYSQIEAIYGDMK